MKGCSEHLLSSARKKNYSATDIAIFTVLTAVLRRILKSSEMLRRVHWYIRSSYQRSEGACNAFVFRVNVRSSLSLSVLGLLDYDDEGTTLLQNVGSYSPVDMV